MAVINDCLFRIFTYKLIVCIRGGNNMYFGPALQAFEQFSNFHACFSFSSWPQSLIIKYDTFVCLLNQPVFNCQSVAKIFLQIRHHDIFQSLPELFNGKCRLVEITLPARGQEIALIIRFFFRHYLRNIVVAINTFDMVYLHIFVFQFASTVSTPVIVFFIQFFARCCRY